MNGLKRELIVAARGIWRQKRFGLAVVATLAITLGSAAAVLTMVESILLRPLPYPDAHQLVFLFRGTSTQVGRGNDLSPGNCAELSKARLFQSMGCWMRSELTVRGEGEAENIAGARIEAQVLDVLGVRVAQGRNFGREDMQPGRDRIAILSHEFWQRRFGGSTRIVGRQIQLDDANFTIVGILPPGFRLYQEKAEIFTPLSLSPESWAKQGVSYLQGVARLDPNSRLDSVRLEVKRVAERLAREYPSDNRLLRLDVIPMQEDLTRMVRAPLVLLLCTTGLLLVIGLANIANLFLTRIQQRAGELAVRRGLGASTGRLMALVGIEALPLCLAGGIGGLLLALVSLFYLESLVPPAMRSYVSMELNWTLAGWVLLLTFVAAMGISLPAGLRAGQMSELRAGTQRSIGSRGVQRSQYLLLTVEVACALLLVLAAGLTVESWTQVAKEPLGMNPAGVLIAKIPPPQESRLAFYDRVIAEIESKPGVESAAFASAAPLTWRGGNFRFQMKGSECEPGSCVALYREVTPKYFETLQIPLRQGRFPGRQDSESSEPVVAVNETFARRFFANGDALGKSIRLGESETSWLRIIGIVADTREMGIEAPPRQTMYIPYRQSKLTFALPAMVMLRAKMLDAAMLRGVTSQPVSEVQTMPSLIADLNRTRTMQSGATSFFAFAALLLAGLGLYGILAYTLSLRRREIGIRLALGASAGQIFFGFNRLPLMSILSGMALGTGAGLVLATWIEPLLFGVRANDPFRFVAALAILALVGAVACFEPTRQAIQLPPAEALRQP